MASKITTEINEIFLETIKSNLLFWIDKDQNIPKLDQSNIRNLVKYGLESEVTFPLAFKLLRQAINLIEKRGDAKEWLSSIEIIINKINLKTPSGTSNKLIVLGQLFFLSRDFYKSSNYFKQALVNKSLLKEDILLNAYIGLCQTEWAVGNYGIARIYGEKALSYSHGAEEKNLNIAKIYNLLGMISLSGMNYSDAWINFQKAKKIFISNKEKLSQMRVENNLAILELYKNNFSGALKRLNKAINYFSETGAEIELIQAQVSKGILFYRIGDLERSRITLAMAIPTTWKNSGSEYHQAWSNLVLGYIELSQNKLKHFKNYLNKSLKYWENCGNQKMIIFVENELNKY